MFEWLVESEFNAVAGGSAFGLALSLFVIVMISVLAPGW